MDNPFDPWAVLAAAQATLANSSSEAENVAREKTPNPSDTYIKFSNSSSFSKPAPKLSQISSEIPKDRKENSIYINQGLSLSVGGQTEGIVGNTARVAEGTPAKVANLLEFEATACNHGENAKYQAARVNRPFGATAANSRNDISMLLEGTREEALALLRQRQVPAKPVASPVTAAPKLHVPGPNDREPISINDPRFYPRQHDPSRCFICGTQENSEQPFVAILTPRPGEHHWIHAGCHGEHSRRIEELHQAEDATPHALIANAGVSAVLEIATRTAEAIKRTSKRHVHEEFAVAALIELAEAGKALLLPTDPQPKPISEVRDS